MTYSCVVSDQRSQSLAYKCPQTRWSDPSVDPVTSWRSSCV